MRIITKIGLIVKSKVAVIIVLYSLLSIPDKVISQDFQFIDNIKWIENQNDIIQLCELQNMVLKQVPEDEEPDLIIAHHQCQYKYVVNFSFINDRLVEIYIYDNSWKANSMDYILNKKSRKLETAFIRFFNLRDLIPSYEIVDSYIKSPSFLDRAIFILPQEILNKDVLRKKIYEVVVPIEESINWRSPCHDYLDGSADYDFNYVFKCTNDVSKFEFDIFDKGFGYVTQLVISSK